MNNPLDKVIDLYKFNIEQQKFFMEIVKNSHKIESNVPAKAILRKYKLSSLKKDEIKKKVDIFKDELNDLTVVSLWSVFEAFLNDKLNKQSDNIKSLITNPIMKEIVSYSLKGADKWLKDEVLDLYKVSIDAKLIGDIKQIYSYRNWVAHGKTRNKPFNLDSFNTYQTLTKFLIKAGLIEELPNEQK